MILSPIGLVPSQWDCLGRIQVWPCWSRCDLLEEDRSLEVGFEAHARPSISFSGSAKDQNVTVTKTTFFSLSFFFLVLGTEPWVLHTPGKLPLESNFHPS